MAPRRNNNDYVFVDRNVLQTLRASHDTLNQLVNTILSERRAQQGRECQVCANGGLLYRNVVSVIEKDITLPSRIESSVPARPGRRTVVPKRVTAMNVMHSKIAKGRMAVRFEAVHRAQNPIFRYTRIAYTSIEVVGGRWKAVKHNVVECRGFVIRPRPE